MFFPVSNREACDEAVDFSAEETASGLASDNNFLSSSMHHSNLSGLNFRLGFVGWARALR